MVLVVQILDFCFSLFLARGLILFLLVYNNIVYLHHYTVLYFCNNIWNSSYKKFTIPSRKQTTLIIRLLERNWHPKLWLIRVTGSKGKLYISWKQLIFKKKIHYNSRSKHTSLLICHGDWTDEISSIFWKKEIILICFPWAIHFFVILFQKTNLMSELCSMMPPKHWIIKAA